MPRHFAANVAVRGALAWALVAVTVGPAGAQTGAAPASSLPMVITPSTYVDSASARRERNGDFFFDVVVNGVTAHMLFDTGASAVSLRAEDAERLGIDASALRYSQVVYTANGAAQVAPVIIATLSVGRVTRHDVPALVSRPGALRFNLLGQSFIARLAGYRIQGDQLILQGGE